MKSRVASDGDDFGGHILCWLFRSLADGVWKVDPPVSVRRFKSVLLALAAFGASATELTPETWDDAVDGKTVFIKFLAPW